MTEDYAHLRKHQRIKLCGPVPAICWFNRLTVPFTTVRILDISRGGMQLHSIKELSKSDCTIAIDLIGSFHGKIIRKEPSINGFLYGFKSDELISTDTIELINSAEEDFQNLFIAQ